MSEKPTFGDPILGQRTVFFNDSQTYSQQELQLALAPSGRIQMVNPATLHEWGQAAAPFIGGFETQLRNGALTALYLRCESDFIAGPHFGSDQTMVFPGVVTLPQYQSTQLYIGPPGSKIVLRTSSRPQVELEIHLPKKDADAELNPTLLETPKPHAVEVQVVEYLGRPELEEGTYSYSCCRAACGTWIIWDDNELPYFVAGSDSLQQQIEEKKLVVGEVGNLVSSFTFAKVLKGRANLIRYPLYHDQPKACGRYLFLAKPKTLMEFYDLRDSASTYVEVKGNGSFAAKVRKGSL